MPDNENTPKVENLKLPSAETFPEEEAKEVYSPAVHGKLSDSMAVMAGQSLPIDRASGTVRITFNGVTMDISDFGTVKGTLGISTHKLLSRGITEFTRYNHVGNLSRELHTLKIAMPFKQYALLCGYDVIDHSKETDTDEEKKKEAKRAKTETDNCLKEVRKDLKLLRNATVSWEEKVRGKEENFFDIGFLGGAGYRNGYIYMEFTQSMGEYLVKLPLTLLPDALYKVDGRSQNAYNMGLKMVEHYYMDSNQRKGTAQLLRVKSLLEVTSLPTLDQLGADRSHWRKRIQEKFENNMESLVTCGVLTDYNYCHSKGVDLTNEEAQNFKDYESWADTLIHFTLKDAPDQTARLEAREEEYKERQEKKKTKKRAAKKKANPDASEETDTAT